MGLQRVGHDWATEQQHGWFFPAKCTPLRVLPIQQLRLSKFSGQKPKESPSVSLSFHNPHPTHQQLLIAPAWKYSQNLPNFSPALWCPLNYCLPSGLSASIPPSYSLSEASANVRSNLPSLGQVWSQALAKLLRQNASGLTPSLWFSPSSLSPQSKTTQVPPKSQDSLQPQCIHSYHFLSLKHPSHL